MGDCRIQLARILNSTDFDATGREHRFFSYVVEETLAGRGDRIKAYSIAVEVFGRGQSFDPQSDPIVRIEAGHLRRAIERYYLTSGQADPILITIPKGGYVPVFSYRERTALAELPAPVVSRQVTEHAVRWTKSRLLMAAVLVVFLAVAASAAWWWTFDRSVAPERPRVLVEAFDNPAGTDGARAVAVGLKEEIVQQLSKFGDILVMESAAKAGDTSIPPPRFVVAGSVVLSPDDFLLRVRLINRANNSILWADSYNGPLKVTAFVDAQAEIARNVSRNLAQTYGIIFQADQNLNVNNAPDDWTAYACTLSFFEYRIEVDAERRSSVRACLEKTVDRFPAYATAWGLLSLIYIDDYRFEFAADPASSSATLQRALDAASQGMALDPSNIRARQAKMLALYFNKDIDAALKLGKQSLEINPNDTEFISEYGERLALSGNWHDGCALVTEARQQNPGATAYYETDLRFARISPAINSKQLRGWRNLHLSHTLSIIWSELLYSVKPETQPKPTGSASGWSRIVQTW